MLRARRDLQHCSVGEARVNFHMIPCRAQTCMGGTLGSRSFLSAAVKSNSLCATSHRATLAHTQHQSLSRSEFSAFREEISYKLAKNLLPSLSHAMPWARRCCNNIICVSALSVKMPSCTQFPSHTLACFGSAPTG